MVTPPFYNSIYNIKKLLYELKQASENWFDLIKTGIERRSYHKYKFDPCVFYRKDLVILTYVDDCLIVSHRQETITSLI